MGSLYRFLPRDLVEKILNEHCDLDTRIKLKLPPRKLNSVILENTETLFKRTKENLTITYANRDMIVSQFFLSSDAKTIFHLCYIYSQLDNIYNMRFSSWKQLECCYLIDNGSKLVIIPQFPSHNTVYFNYKDGLIVTSKSYRGAFIIPKEFKEKLIKNKLLT
jgi:hypothetical protein